jgi:hypothetical protein
MSNVLLSESSLFFHDVTEFVFQIISKSEMIQLSETIKNDLSHWQAWGHKLSLCSMNQLSLTVLKKLNIVQYYTS